MHSAKRTFLKALALLLALTLAPGVLPGTALASESGYTYTQNGSSGATITFTSPVTGVSGSQEGIATAGFSGSTVTVTGLDGAVGVTTVTVAAGGSTYAIAVPVGYTTFVFDDNTVTVYEGSDTKYEVIGIDRTDTEYTAASASNSDGSTTYSVASGADYSLSVEIKKSGGTYVFTGTGSDMSIAVKKNAEKDAVLLLAGLDLTSSLTAPITVKKKDDEAAIDADAKVYITALEGHTNTLTDAAYNNADDYADNALAESAVIKCKAYADLILDGHGTLNLACSSKNALKVAEYGTLALRELTLNVTSAGHGISCDNDMTFWSGTVNVASGGDGIRSDPDAVDAENGAAGTITFYDADVTVASGGDGIQAAQDLTICGGSFRITTFGGYTKNSALGDSSAKGLKASASSSDDTTDTSEAANYIHIYNGDFILDCADDAIHSDGYICIEGGSFEIRSGDDGVHADTSLTLGAEGGPDCAVQMKINYCYEGLEAGSVYFYSGSYDVYSTDDGVNAAGGSGGDGQGFNPGGGPGGPGGPRGRGFGGASLLAAEEYSLNIYGGLLKVVAAGDGLDSNGDLNMTGGTVVVWGGSGAENPLDYDGTFYINGATVFAAGYNNMAARNPANGSQSYQTKTTSLTQGRTVTVTVNGAAVVSQRVERAASYEFYSQPDSFSSMTVSQDTGAAADTPATWLSHSGSGDTCSVCGLHTNGASGHTDAEASDTDDRVAAEGSKSGEADGDRTGALTLPDGSKSVEWSYAPGSLQVTATGDVGEDAMFFAAAYGSSGQMLSAGIITESGGAANVGEGAAALKLFWLDGNYIPLCACAELELSADA